MKILKPRVYKKIYRMLDEVSPVSFDCGEICGEACCHMADNDYGIFLLPGEERIQNPDHWLSFEWVDATECVYPAFEDGKLAFVRCAGPSNCDRKNRPIQCRTFPYLPVIKNDGSLVLSFNEMELDYCCPLAEQRVRPNKNFIKRTLEAWRILIRDTRIRDALYKGRSSMR